MTIVPVGKAILSIRLGMNTTSLSLKKCTINILEPIQPLISGTMFLLPTPREFLPMTFKDLNFMRYGDWLVELLLSFISCLTAWVLVSITII